MARMLLGLSAGASPSDAAVSLCHWTVAGEMPGKLAAWDMVGFLIGPIMASSR